MLSTNAPAVAPDADQPQKNILVVDDDQAQLDAIRQWLTEAGYQPLTVRGGQEGVGLCRQQRFDLILADITNPASDGFHVLLAAAIETPDLPVIILGAAGDSHSLRTAWRAGAWDYLQHPLERDEMLDRIHVAIKRAERLTADTHRLPGEKGEAACSAEEIQLRALELEEANRRLKKEVGARQEVGAQLKRTINDWQATFDSISDFITIHNQDYTIVKANKALLDFLGKQPEEVIGRKCYDIMHGSAGPWPTCPHRGMMETGEAYTTEVIDPNIGIPLLVTASPIRKDDEVIGFIHIAKDISRIKLLEEERRRDLNLESLSTLCSGLAHDFNNLLTALGGYIELSLLDDPPPSQQHWLNQAKMVTNLSIELTKQLLAFSKGGEPMLTKVSVETLLKENLTHLQKSMPQMQIEEQIADDVWPILGDHSQLRTAIRNICYNAAEAMAGGGTLHIEAHNIPKGDSQDCPLDQDAVLLNFTDQGVGIAAEVIDRVFDPYFTTSPKGAAKGKGLGLSICYTIINRHHGRISLDSQPGRGTTVTLCLPAAH